MQLWWIGANHNTFLDVKSAFLDWGFDIYLRLWRHFYFTAGALVLHELELSHRVASDGAQVPVFSCSSSVLQASW